jgi:hypothetical protein
LRIVRALVGDSTITRVDMGLVKENSRFEGMGHSEGCSASGVFHQ